MNNPGNQLAFPQTIDDMGTVHSVTEAMSLRDYFANSVLNGICLNESYIAAIATDKDLPDELKPSKLAQICYELADAMLEERLK